ncbi:MAG: SLBB domain-containing protein, partial [Endomicrobiia bacterium]|nr:SLBB domain-containing protein [Endomicrobiia bacterium]
GVVGAGGAGFPTHAKLAVPPTVKIDTIIANGAECEPLLRIDQQMAAVRADKLVRGVELAMQATGALKGVIALKKKYHAALDAVEAEIKKSGRGNISVFQLDNFYPAGDEFVTVYEVTRRIIPEGGLPLAVGCVVDNVVTLINIADAVDEKKPVTQRPLTVTGAVKNPVSMILPVGTPVSKAIELAGGPDTNGGPYVIFDGGPMMGSIVGADAVVTKKTSGIMLLPSSHEIVMQKTNRHAVKQIKSACEQCQDCTEICPRYLLGHNFECHKIQRGVQAGKSDSLTQVFMCCECGLCDWVCPVKLTPRRANQLVKSELIKNGVKNPHVKKPLAVREMREYRRVSLARVIARNDLVKYDRPASLNESSFEINEVIIPLRQNVGAPPEPVVKPGDIVKKGGLIARIPDGKLSANLHASIDGKVVEVKDYIKIMGA